MRGASHCAERPSYSWPQSGRNCALRRFFFPMRLAEDGFVAAVAATSRATFFTAFQDLAQRDFCAAVKTCNWCQRMAWVEMHLDGGTGLIIRRDINVWSSSA
jgi:hypothetical protein